MKAIVVDDDRATVEVIVKAVNWEKFSIDRVFTAYDAAEAKRIMTENKVDLVISDIEMPMESGLDLLRWIRDTGTDAQVIFLTSHERFDFAQMAIQYNASGYVVKPFNVSRMESEITTAVQKIRHEQEYREGQKYEQWFSGNLSYVEYGFWEDLLQGHFAADRKTIGEEILRRKLPINPDSEYRLALVTALFPESPGTAAGNTGSTEAELLRLASGIFSGRPEADNTVSLRRSGMFYIASVLDCGEESIRKSAGQLIREGREKQNCTLTVYIGNLSPMDRLPESLNHLMELDKNNVASKGAVFAEDDEIVLNRGRADGHILDQEQIRLLLSEKKTKELLNLLKFSMEGLAAEKKLDAAAMTKIRQELLQAVYVYLNSKEVIAAQLFANPASEALERKAADSMMDMVRWQVYLVSQTVNYVTDIEQSDSVVNRAKAFIHEHYAENISRTEIAASMYLTPEYMAKIFKKETGVSLKQYLSDYRIARAKELLTDPNVRVSDAAGRVGFDNLSYFSTVFKKTVGMSPNDYQNEVLRASKNRE